MVDREQRFTPESEATRVRLEQEVRGANHRVQNFFDNARKAEALLVTEVCDDSRVDVSPEPDVVPDVFDRRRYKLTQFVALPVIGGGVPDTRIVRAVVDTLTSDGVDPRNIRMIVTQHGSDEEVRAVIYGRPPDKLTCGLRGVVAAIGSVELSRLKSMRPADQHRSLERLSGEKGIPAPILRRALSSSSPNMTENALATRASVEEQLSQIERPIPVHAGLYDHTKKRITILDTEGNAFDTISMRGLKEWREPFQDPAVGVVSLGPRAAAIPHGIVLSETVGGTGNNDFSSVAVDRKTLIDALGEQLYPLSHRAQHAVGHGHDPNFKSLEAEIFIADGRRMVDIAKEVLGDPSIRAQFGEALKTVGGVHVVNLEQETVETISF